MIAVVVKVRRRHRNHIRIRAPTVLVEYADHVIAHDAARVAHAGQGIVVEFAGMRRVTTGGTLPHTMGLGAGIVLIVNRVRHACTTEPDGVGDDVSIGAGIADLDVLADTALKDKRPEIDPHATVHPLVDVRGMHTTSGPEHRGEEQDNSHNMALHGSSHTERVQPLVEESTRRFSAVGGRSSHL